MGVRVAREMNESYFKGKSDVGVVTARIGQTGSI